MTPPSHTSQQNPWHSLTFRVRLGAMDEPGRKKLPHDPPAGIGVGGQVVFLTFCALHRELRPLTLPGVPEILLEAARNRMERGLWFVKVMVVMPDHVHLLVRLPLDGSLRRIVSDWKRWTAMRAKIEWQRGFFDHRLRGEESGRKKTDYILNNPVHAGLGTNPSDWPHVLIGDGSNRRGTKGRKSGRARDCRTLPGTGWRKREAIPLLVGRFRLVPP